MKKAYDKRTHVYRDGVETTQLGIRKGDRAYVDTMLDGHRQELDSAGEVKIRAAQKQDGSREHY